MEQNNQMAEQGQSLDYDQEQVINTLLQKNAELTRENAIFNAVITRLMNEKQQNQAQEK